MIGTATLRQLVSLGLTPQQILAVAEAMEVDAGPKDKTAAERQRRHRAKKAQEEPVTRDEVTRDVTRDPPNDNIPNPPVPTSNEVGADGEIEVSPETILWNTGKAFLIRHGVPKSRAGSALGKWKREHGVGGTMEALAAAERESRNAHGLVDPISFIEGVFKHREGECERPIC